MDINISENIEYKLKHTRILSKINKGEKVTFVWVNKDLEPESIRIGKGMFVQFLPGMTRKEKSKKRHSETCNCIELYSKCKKLRFTRNKVEKS